VASSAQNDHGVFLFGSWALFGRRLFACLFGHRCEKKRNFQKELYRVAETPLEKKRMSTEDGDGWSPGDIAAVAGVAGGGLAGLAVFLRWMFPVCVIWKKEGHGAAVEHAISTLPSRQPSPAPSLAPPPPVRAGRRSASDPVILEPTPRISISISEHKTPAPTSEEPEDAAELSLPGQAEPEVQELDFRDLEREELAQAENQRASLNSSLAETLSAVLDRWRNNRNQVAPAASQESPA